MDAGFFSVSSYFIHEFFTRVNIFQCWRAQYFSYWICRVLYLERNEAEYHASTESEYHVCTDMHTAQYYSKSDSPIFVKGHILLQILLGS